MAMRRSARALIVLKAILPQMFLLLFYGRHVALLGTSNCASIYKWIIFTWKKNNTLSRISRGQKSVGKQTAKLKWFIHKLTVKAWEKSTELLCNDSFWTFISTCDILHNGHWCLSVTSSVHTLGACCYLLLFCSPPFACVLCNDRPGLAFRRNYKDSVQRK